MALRTIVGGVLVLGLGGPPWAAVASPPATAATDLSGSWTYDARLSDDARQKLREAIALARSAADGTTVPGEADRWNRDEADPRRTMPSVFEPAEGLTIEQSSQQVRMDEAYGGGRTLHTDGRARKGDNGTSEVRAWWKEGRLAVETKHDRGGTLVETWELSASGSRLVATYTIKGGPGPKLSLKHVYTRAPNPSPDNAPPR